MREPRRVLVTGVGGAPGLQTARALLARGYQVIAADTHPLAAGLRLPGVTAQLLPHATDPAYPDGLLAACRQLRPDAVIPGIEHEIPSLIALRETLAELGAATWLPDLPAVLACLDKARFHEVMSDCGLPVPSTWLPYQLEEIPDGVPLVVKPRRGQGARQVHSCRTRAQARVLCELVDDPLIQEEICGREFTADCLTDDHGRSSVVLRYREIVKGGLAVVATTFHHPQISALVSKALEAVAMVGVSCAQGFLCEDGRVVITEVNARLAGAFPLSQAAGADLIGQLLNGLAGRPIDHDRLAYNSGIRLTTAPTTLAIEETNAP